MSAQVVAKPMRHTRLNSDANEAIFALNAQNLARPDLGGNEASKDFAILNNPRSQYSSISHINLAVEDSSHVMQS